MKKLLSLLAAVGITASSSILAVSCSHNKSNEKKIDIKSDNISNKVLDENVQNLNSLDEVNTKLKEFVDNKTVAGLTGLTASLKTGSQTDVVVEITIDTTSYNLVGESTFEITGAIKYKEVIKLKINDIKEKTKGIKNKKNVNEVNNDLKKIEIKEKGVFSLRAKQNSVLPTNVDVIVITEEGYSIDSNSYTIENAIIKSDNKNFNIAEIKDKRLNLTKRQTEISFDLDISNYDESVELSISSEAYLPAGSQNNYPQKSNVTKASIDKKTVTIKSIGDNNIGEDLITIKAGKYKPVNFKVYVYKETYIENPGGKNQSAFYTWEEANPNRKNKNIQKNTNGLVPDFSPYIDAALYSGDKVSDIINRNKNLESLTLAFANQDNKEKNKLSISFAGLNKNDGKGAYDWYINRKLVPDILKPLADKGIFQNSKVSYGGYNAGNNPEVNLPWVLANKISKGDETKAQEMLETSLIEFQEELAQLVNQKIVKKIDFDIEGIAQNSKYKKDNSLLAKTIAEMKKKDKEWDFSVTLPVLNTGLVDDENSGMGIVNIFINEYAKQGLSIKDLPKFNLMVMDFGNNIYQKAIDDNKTNFNLVKEAIDNSVEQIQSIINSVFKILTSKNKIYSLIGATPMIGVNDTELGIFTLEDAKELYNWAGEVGLNYIGMWSINDDRGLSYPIYDDPNFPGGVYGAQPTNKSQTSHGLLYLNEYDFTKTFLGDWELI